jgi:hypothetical protein
MNNLKKFLVAIIAIVSVITVNAGTKNIDDEVFWIQLNLVNKNNTRDTVLLAKHGKTLSLHFKEKSNIEMEGSQLCSGNIYPVLKLKILELEQVKDSVIFDLRNIEKMQDHNTLNMVNIKSEMPYSYIDRLSLSMGILHSFYKKNYSYEIALFQTKRYKTPVTTFKVESFVVLNNGECITSIDPLDYLTDISSRYNSFDENYNLEYHSLLSLRTEFFCSYTLKNKKASKLAFHIDYYAEDWLFIYEIRFKINGVLYKLTDLQYKMDHDVLSGGDISETWYPYVSKNYQVKVLLNALLKAKGEVKVQYVGTKGIVNSTMDEYDLQAIKDCVKDFKAKGGIY